MKKTVYGLAFTLLIGSVLAPQAWAVETLPGNYEGKIQSVNGYGANLDEACTVSISTSDIYGGSFVFEIQGIEKLTIEKRRVASDLKSGTSEYTWVSPGGFKKAEVIGLNVSENGTPVVLKLLIKDVGARSEKIVVCGDLKRKQ